MTTNVLGFLEEQAKNRPEAIAVTEDNRNITYGKLMEESRRIGSALGAAAALTDHPVQSDNKAEADSKSGIENENEQGADSLAGGPDAVHWPVGVYMEKGTDALSAFFGIVYSGCCYSMLNPELPDARLSGIGSVLQIKAIVTQRVRKEKAERLFPGAEVFCIEDLRSHAVNDAFLASIRENSVDTDPLYINFTSGSTGIPKGIVVSHRSVIDFITCFTDIFHITSEDVIANQAPFDFDVSVKDIYSAMYAGAELVIVPRELFSAPARLIDYLCEKKVTVLIWAVSALCLISTFHGLDYRTPESIRKILFSGEIMPYRHLSEWRKHLPDAMYANLYGPTEITCNCTYHILEKDRDYADGIPAGKHFPNEDVFLLSDEGRRITRAGDPGRIMVRGTALALGYYRLPEKNALQFIQNPLQQNYPEPVYDTGDLGKYNDRGELMFLGRSDNQIKHMGHRIELEEIERAMNRVRGVERSVCIFDRKKDRLKGFYMGTATREEIHRILEEVLPVYMIPGFIRKMDQMPLTKNGKTDRRKVLEMCGG
ncbi:AMP-binding protein [[Clostridium] aminophilum]|uniref:AMP-binding protein n=1 Tax=[Clostridium] aminophilum TaxID=1526 RepID=UPI0033275AEB